jgi:hypothetical protein
MDGRLLTPSTELLKEVYENSKEFECRLGTKSDWILCDDFRGTMLLLWATGDPTVQIRRKQLTTKWIPEVGKLIAVRDVDGAAWEFRVSRGMEGDGRYLTGTFYAWNQARPVLPEELSK